jgi:hypothetical protein
MRLPNSKFVKSDHPLIKLGSSKRTYFARARHRIIVVISLAFLMWLVIRLAFPVLTAGLMVG